MSSLKQIRISVKILLIVVVAILGMAVLGFTGYRSMVKADADLDNMYNSTFPRQISKQSLYISALRGKPVRQ